MEAACGNKDTTLTSGCYVSTVNAKIAPCLIGWKTSAITVWKSMEMWSKKVKCLLGTFWYISIKSRNTIYVLGNNRIVANLFSPFPHCLVDKNDNSPDFLNNNTCGSDNEKIILSHILNSKIHKISGHNCISMCDLMCIFKPKFPWLNLTKMYRFLKEETGAGSNTIFSTEAAIAQEEGKPLLWFNHDLLLSHGKSLYICAYIWAVLYTSTWHM